MKISFCLNLSKSICFDITFFLLMQVAPWPRTCLLTSMTGALWLKTPQMPDKCLLVKSISRNNHVSPKVCWVNIVLAVEVTQLCHKGAWWIRQIRPGARGPVQGRVLGNRCEPRSSRDFVPREEELPANVTDNRPAYPAHLQVSVQLLVFCLLNFSGSAE